MQTALRMGAVAMLVWTVGCGDDDASSTSDGGDGNEGGALDGSSDSATHDASGDASGEDDASGGDSGQPGPCEVEVCEGGRCDLQPAAEGTPLASQTAGDCQRRVCDGAGGTRVEVEPGDTMDDGNACTVDACDTGSPTHEPEPGGTVCSQDGGQVCDGDGACVECFANGDCTGSDVCRAGACVPAICGNGSLDVGETDIDCGGDTCGPCAAGDDCLQDDDCASSECAGTCVANCEDGERNNTESDVDCGPGCSTCDNGDDCSDDAHCTSGYCDLDDDRCAAPTCVDGVRNQGEDEVDCGGPCPACPAGCSDDDDCDGAGELCWETQCVTALNGCERASATDRTDEANVEITFGCSGGCAYTPACVIVSVGTIVTFSGSFGSHPLVGGVYDASASPSEIPGGTAPLTGTTGAGSSAPFTLADTGVYPYYCDQHSGGGMYGAIFVE